MSRAKSDAMIGGLVPAKCWLISEGKLSNVKLMKITPARALRANTTEDSPNNNIRKFFPALNHFRNL
jgi:hypothetical protein